MARFIQTCDGFDPERECGLCGAPLNEHGDYAEPKTPFADPMLVSLLLHAYTATPIAQTEQVRRALDCALKEQLLTAGNNLGFGYVLTCRGTDIVHRTLGIEMPPYDDD